jgi:Carboxypeptidase regulatory-like domain
MVMKKCFVPLGLLVWFILLAPASAQDYRGRVQGHVVDESKAAIPGATVTLKNDATAVVATRVTNNEGRYLFDFVEPGSYSLTAELEGFSKAEQRGLRVQQRGDATADFTLKIGALTETVTVQAEAVQVQLNSSSTTLTFERQLIDQIPISGRNPYNLSMLDPTLSLQAGNANENRPYHHAYANEYDAGGGTRRANDVLLDGVALGASFKTSYTPSMDAVEEMTVSKNSVDAENGNSLGGVITLNMKSGTNVFKGSAYYFARDPRLNALSDPTVKPTAGFAPSRGTNLDMFGGTIGGPIVKNKVFSFTSYERWNDNKPVTVIRTVPTDLERHGDFSQSVYNGKIRTVYDPWTSRVVNNKVVRTAFPGNVIPTNRLDPVSQKLLAQIPLPNQPGNVDNWQGNVNEHVDYWNFSQRVDLNISNNFKVFARYGQFKANVYQQNPTDAQMFPVSGSNRYGMSTAADAVWVMSNRATLNFRGSYYNMVDEYANPQVLLGTDGLEQLWPGNAWYQSLYVSPYIYWPAVDVSVAAPTSLDRFGRQGNEWFQRPDAWTSSARMNFLAGKHNMKWGGEIRAYYGEAARFNPMNFQFRANLTQNSTSSPDTVNTGNQWATFMLGAIDNNSTANLVPLQNPDLKAYAAYFQDEFRLNDRVTLNLGLRWEYQPGPTDAEYRLSQQIDLTQPIPEMQATPPAMPAQAVQLMAAQGHSYIYNGAWIFTSKSSPNAWHEPWANFQPRFGINYRFGNETVMRFGYARYVMPTQALRDTLGAFTDQYSGYNQSTTALALVSGVPQQVVSNPFPATTNPVIAPYNQSYGRYTNLGGIARLDQYNQTPQINDRFNLSFQHRLAFDTIFEANYFYNHASHIPFTYNLNMVDPTYSYGAGYGAWVFSTSVPNPFYKYLTPDKFPGQLRNASNVNLNTLLVPYPQYQTLNQFSTDGFKGKTHTFEVRAQRPAAKGFGYLLTYAYNYDVAQNWYDDIHQYEFQTKGTGLQWRPVLQVGQAPIASAAPRHRVTAAATVDIPVGRNRHFGSDMPAALDYVVGGWQYAVTARWNSGGLLQFQNTYIVDGNPTLANPQPNGLWFDTSKFHPRDTYTPRANPWYYDGLNGPGAFQADMNLTKMFKLTPRYRLEARIEAYNAFNTLNWADPDMTLGSATFGMVTRKNPSYFGREVQVGFRFIF